MQSSNVSCFGAAAFTRAFVRYFVLVLALLLGPGFGGHVRAQTNEVRAQARALFEQGLEAADSERWAEAADFFTRSRELLPRPSTLFNLVGALYRLGRYREGVATAQDYLGMSDPVGDAAKRKEVESLRDTMSKALGTLHVELAPAAASLDVDGEPLAASLAGYTLRLDPGVHALVARYAGHRDHSESFMLARGGNLNLRVQLEPVAQADSLEGGEPAPRLASPRAPVAPAAPAPDAKRRKRVRRALWITGAVLVAGAVATGLAIALRPDKKESCQGGSEGICLE